MINSTHIRTQALKRLAREQGQDGEDQGVAEDVLAQAKRVAKEAVQQQQR